MLHLLVVFFIASVHGYYGSQVDDFVGKVGLSTDVPKCATSYKHLNGNSTFLCLDDDDYPVFEIENSLYYHYYSISSMYKVINYILVFFILILEFEPLLLAGSDAKYKSFSG